jgi:ABC-type Fe3+ transport system permease subunit
MTLIALPAWLFGLALPLVWLIYSALGQITPLPGIRSTDAQGPSLQYVWQLKLHAASLLLILLASVIAIVLAVLAAYAFARLGRATVVWAAAAVLVVPPMVYGYLWYLTVGHNLPLPGLPGPLNLGVPNLPFVALTAWSIGLWLWPIPALLLAAGWQWSGKPAWLLARMDASDAAAFLRGGLPAMRPYLAASLAICLLLAAQEYAVPALFSVQVWQTQWLALAQAGMPLGKLAIAALPAEIVLFGCIILFARFWRTVESRDDADLGVTVTTRASQLYARGTLAGLLGLTVVLPSIGAVVTMPKGLHFVPGRFAPELMDTPVLMVLVATLAAAAGLVALPVGRLSRNPSGSISGRRRGNAKPGLCRTWMDTSGLDGPSPVLGPDPQRGCPRPRGRGTVQTGGYKPLAGCSRFGWLILILAAVSWTLPMGLLAEAARQVQIAGIAALPQAVRGAPLDWERIQEGLDLLVWASVLAGRFLPIVWLILSLVTRSLPADLTEQAAVDGSSRAEFRQKVLLPILAPALLASWLICALLAATETAAATMLRPPGFDALSVSLLNQMHYGRDSDVVAICLVLVLAAATGAGVVAAGLRRVGGRR